MTKIEPVEQGEGNTKTSPKKKQSIQMIKHFFTFNNYTKSDIDTILETIEPISISFCFQEETGESGTRHLQGCIKLKRKMRFEEFKLPKQIHWEKVISWEHAVKYCSKEETRTGLIYSKGLPKELKLISKLKNWQQTIINMTNEEPDDRTINWIYDKIGCMGKTTFSKYLYAKTDAIIATGGGNKDIACMLAGVAEEGRDLNEKTTFVFNFPRCTEGVSYKAIESVKDGLITSTKYHSETLVFNCPHVFIFSNEKPLIHKLSMDRWKLWTIVDEELVSYEMPLEEDDEF